ncbi:hypothetical protein PI124_g13020 [Phytophthora idaei]|nr:hypothetical protein PI125_g25462 [Phytophthora idaei]KAG3158537.1 hypothetical protein PI126_g7811 [Phytophthora idaei]KAG3242122.1 hypothetical protein PI124_g13020 [Phytophthora idaei]
MTGRPVKAAGIHLEPLPEVSELLNLEEMAVDDFLADLKAREIAEVMLLNPETTPEALNSSPVLDEYVLEEMKKRRDTRLGSGALKNPKDPVYPLVKEFADVVSKDPPSQLPPDRGVRLEIDLVPGTKYCVTRQWHLPREQCESSMRSLPRRQRQAWCGNRNPHTRRQPSAFGNQTGSGVWFTLTTS